MHSVEQYPGSEGDLKRRALRRWSQILLGLSFVSIIGPFLVMALVTYGFRTTGLAVWVGMTFLPWLLPGGCFLLVVALALRLWSSNAHKRR